MSGRIRLAYVTTIPAAQWFFLRGQNGYLRKRGFDIHAISSPGADLDNLAERDHVVSHPLPIARTIAPIQDFVTLCRLFLTFRKIRPHIAHVSTPKAALLGSIAAYAARVPIRIFCFRGSITEPASDMRRKVYRWVERLTARLCTHTICVSESLLRFARSESILTSTDGMVPASGMSNGIDVQKFTPDGDDAAWRRSLPESISALARDSNAVVIGYVGRLARDKGIEELAAAWTSIRAEFVNVHLLLVGPWEKENPVSAEARAIFEGDDRVHLTGLVEGVAPLYRLMSLFVFPSWGSEGFPNAPMEAAAMRLPVIATRVVGCVDAVEHETTGLLVPPRDGRALANAMRVYLNRPELRREHGQAGRRRVLRDFRQEAIWEALYREYVSLLRQRGFAPSTLSSRGSCLLAECLHEEVRP
jgi:glycosyltransferase involved in cell wall biosynthesis